ncbi:hypothetical protein G3A_15685 [Bacillus sp. 17376]|uniref:fructose-bisphosphatase n=1 Tax=Mesobacillus boroniphilus JCM 21738 TaxID=1294265 RepID=W4RW97_9BACI|nr:hypothetical protein G3A_15685 [Bacillus sp. 17376]GAE48392.1 fructose-1,6-bisphosphatase [Mesobacillus boroniphilus JCM 21738]
MERELALEIVRVTEAAALASAQWMGGTRKMKRMRLRHTGVDLFVRIGGAPEGVISAAAIKALGGDMQARLVPQTIEEEERCIAMGLKDPRQLLMLHDLVSGDDAIFAANGVSSGELLGGVRFLGGDLVETHSIVMRSKTKTVRYITAHHHLEHKPHLVMV